MTRQNERFERSKEGIVLRTLGGRINLWNRSSEEIYGWRKEEAIGKISHELLRTRFPEPLCKIESELEKKGRWQGKLVHARRDGGDLLVESQWIMDLGTEPPSVVEINSPASEYQTNSEARKDDSRVKGVNEDKAPDQLVGKWDDFPSTFANIVLSSVASVSILVLLYFIYHYGWTAEREFSNAFAMVLYWIFPAVLAGVCFGFLKRSREFRVNAAILCISVAFSVCVIELTLAFFTYSASRSGVTLWGDVPATHQKEIVALAKKMGIDFDTRTKIDVVRDLRERGVSAVPAIVPSDLLVRQPDGNFRSKITIDGAEVLPLGGMSNRVTVLCNETGSYSFYDSDERGFNNPYGIWRSSAIAIAALGDSFTSGACVPSDKNFVALVREQNPGTLNLGMLGNGPLSMLGAVKEYLPFVKPKVVLWFFFEGNDFIDLLNESKTGLLGSYLRDDFNQNLFGRQADIDQALTAHVEQAFNAELIKQDTRRYMSGAWETVESLLKLSHLRQRLGLINESSAQGEYGESSEAQLNLFHTVLSRAKESVEGWGGTVYFVYLPARERYSNEQNYNRELVLARVKDLAIPVIDIHRSFQKHDDPLSFFPFRRFGHYNEAGNRVVAEEVLRVIALKGS